MKKIYNQADITDMPLDSEGEKVVKKTTSADAKPATNKAKISVISSKKTSTTAKKPASKKPATKTSTSKSASAKSTTSKTSTTKSTATKSTASKSVKTEKESKEVEQPKKQSLRTRLKSDNVDVVDLEKLNEENLKSRSFRSRRNQMIIIVLSVLLAITVAAIAIYLSFVTLESNCLLYVHGDANAAYLINGEEMDKFRAPNTIQGNRVFQFSTKLKIESSGEFDIKFEIKVFRDNVLLEDIRVYDVNNALFKLESDGAYHSREPIKGKQTIWICKGVDLIIKNEKRLNKDNFKMEIHTTLTKA